MARSMRQALMGEEQIGTLDNPGSASPLGPTLSMRTGAFLRPLLQAAKDKFPKHNPRGRWLGEMLLGDSPQRTGRVAEGIPDQYFHFNRGSGSNVSPELVDLAGALPIASTLKLAKAAAVPAAMATGAGLLGRAVKGNRVAPESDEMMSAILGPAMQRQGLLDDAMVGVDPSPFYSGEKLTKEQRALRRAELRAEANALRFGDDDYRIQHSSPAPEGKNSIDDPSDIYDHNIYGAKGAQYYGTGDPAMDKATIKILNEVKQNPDSLVTIYRAVPSDVDDAINAGDWITINKDYAKNHGESALNGDYKIIEQQARAGDIFTNGDSLHEQGWHPGNRDPAIAATPEPSVDEFIGGLLDDNAIEPMWSPKALKDAANQNHKSRNILIGMAPQEFLRMTDDLSKPDLFKKTRIADAREAGNQMDSVPMLGFDNMGEGRAKVVAHEGRHRALRAIEEGHDIIPVLLNSQEGGNAAAIRWGSQEPGTRDYVDDFPTILEAQGKKTDALPFPVQRNQTAPSVDEFVGKLLDDELPMDEASRMPEGGIPYEDKLITQHNLTPENLLHADRMGGMPMPSIGIAKAGNPLTNYGEISLIEGANLATPSRKNPVYSADAYSPRYPSLDYRLKDAKTLQSKIQESIDAVGDRYFRGEDGDFDTRGADAFKEDNAMMHAFLKESGVTPKIPEMTGEYKDRYRIRDSLRNQIRDAGMDDEMSKWSVEMAKLGGIEERIFKGYTNAGNRRYAAHTLDNAIKEMRKSDGESASMFGAGSFRSKVAPKFKNFGEVQAARSRILSPEDVNILKEKSNEKLADLSAEIATYAKYKGEKNQFTAQNLAMENMIDAVRGKSRWDEFFDDVPLDLKTRIGDFVQELKDMPTEYFEAKPQRAVSLEEFQGAIIPEDASPEVLNVLKRRGINRIQKYKTPEQRKEAFKAFEDLMYSAGGAGVLSGLYEPDALKDDEAMRRALLRN